MNIVDETIGERSAVYGPPHESHANIGLAWTAIINQHYQIKLAHPIPSHIAELMMVAFKIQRSLLTFKQDNYVDAKAYLAFAEHGQEHPGEPFPMFSSQPSKTTTDSQ